MSAVADVTLSSDKQTLKVTGILNFETVADLYHQADVFIVDVDNPIFDFQGVTRTESPALALLTAWRRKSHGRGKVARFIHVPSDLMDIAKLSNVEKILGLEE